MLVSRRTIFWVLSLCCPTATACVLAGKRWRRERSRPARCRGSSGWTARDRCGTTLRILRKPPVTRTLLVAFDSVLAAGNCVAEIIAAGIVPAAMEFMDRRCIAAVEDYCAPGYPKDADAILIIEVDGVAQEAADAPEQIPAMSPGEPGATATREAKNEAERVRLWRGPQSRFPRDGMVCARDMLCMDGTIPRRALPKVLARMAEMSEEYGLGFCNVFHAGDGNLHPLIIFDVMKPVNWNAQPFGAETLETVWCRSGRCAHRRARRGRGEAISCR